MSVVSEEVFAQKAKIAEFNQKALEKGFDAYVEKMEWVVSPFNGDDTITAIHCVDNIAFIYALFASKKADNILLASQRLLALLPFANSQGFFPDYFHAFPKSSGDYTTLHVLCVFKLLLQEFKKVLAPSLAAKLKHHIQLALTSLGEREKISKGVSGAKKYLYQALAGDPITDIKIEFLCQEDWLYFILCNRLTGSVDLTEHVKEHYLLDFERPKSASYPLQLDGPCLYKDLLHYLVNYFTLSEQHLTSDNFLILRSAIFLPIESKTHCNSPSFYTSLYEKELGRYGCQLWRLYYKDNNALYSLVLEKGVLPLPGREQQTLTWQWPDETFEDRENQEIVLYINNPDTFSILVNGEKSTLFRLGDKISIVSETKTLNLCFDKIEGEGDFVGQIALGNRSAQNKAFVVGSAPTDQIISIRTLRRNSGARIKLSYSITTDIN